MSANMSSAKVSVVLLGVLLVSISPAITASKVQTSVLKEIQQKGTANIIISFKGSNLEKVRNDVNVQEFVTREDRINSLYSALKNHADTTQASVMSILQSARLAQATEIRQFWITNQVAIKNADKNLIEQLSSQDEISEILAEKIYYVGKPVPLREAKRNVSAEMVQWGVKAISAPEVWSTGNRGGEVVVATIDTGVNGQHEALRDGFRQDHGWYDPIYRFADPYDDHGHGTHVTGTIVGRMGGIGVAPEAQWISCKGCNSGGSCYQSDLLACGQWVLCPTDRNGGNLRCDLAPHVVSNSWGGALEDSYFYDAVAAWIQAGIFPVFAAGNAGRDGCSTVGGTSTNPNVIGVGSLNEDNTISVFSSRGPSLEYNSIQPDVAAPGNLIISAHHLADSQYQTMSGTSMATPHVAGLIALLYSQRQNLTIEEIRFLVLEGAQPLKALNEVCGGVRDDVYPNNHAGSGGINAVESINAIDRLPEPEDPPSTTPSLQSTTPSSQETLTVYRIKAFVLLSLVLCSTKGIMLF